MAEMTRKEALQWCKDRALAFLPEDTGQALASFQSDVQKFPELLESLKHTIEVLLPMALYWSMHGNTEEVRKYIEGFN